MEALSPNRPENEHAEVSLVSSMNGLVKTTCQVNYSINNKHCLPGDLSNEHTDFSSIIVKWPFQDNLTCLALHIQKRSNLGDLYTNHPVSHLCRYETDISKHQSYELTSIINLTCNPSIQTFHIIGICS